MGACRFCWNPNPHPTGPFQFSGAELFAAVALLSMHTRDIMIAVCYCVVFVMLGIALKHEYFGPTPMGERAKKLQISAYMAAAIGFAVIGTIHFMTIRH